MWTFFKKNIFLSIILIIVIALRIQFEFSYTDYSTDKSYQINCARNFINGNGFMVGETDIADLGKISFRPLVGWPLGYSVLLAPVLFISKDVVFSINFIDALFICLFFYSIVGLFKILNFNKRSLILLLIFYGLTFSLFYYANSTDLIAFSLFQLAIYLAIKNLQNINLKHIIFIALISFLPSLIRYAYQPLSFTIPFSLIVFGYIFKNKSIFKKGCWIVLILVVCVLIFNICEDYRIGNFHVLRDKTGFYFDNLYQFTPFPFESFFFLKSLILKYDETINGLYLTYIILSLVISALIIMLVIYQFNRIYKTARTAVSNNEKLFILYFTGLLTVFILIAFLSFFSLRYAPQANKIPLWTYVSESRYFSAGIVFIQIVVFSVVFDKYNKWIAFLLKSFVMVVFIINIGYWLNEKYAMYVKKSARIFIEDYKEQLETCAIINEIKSGTNKKIIYIDAIPKNYNFVTDIGNIYSGTCNYTWIVNSKIFSSEKIVILIAMPQKLSLIENNFVRNHKAEKIHSNSSYDIYKIDMK